MQSLDVISINLWDTVISLCNLLLLFYILKRFLYKPVKRVLKQRQEALDEQYSAAARAQQDADTNRLAWAEKMRGAQDEADQILKNAAASADYRGGQIISEARDKAADIVRRAEAEAELEHKKAEAGIKREIVDVSAALTEKLLGREINTDDHHAIIDSFINGIGEDDDGNE